MFNRFNGANDLTELEDLIDISDGVMLDVKAIDSKFHTYLTGKTNDIVLKNLNFLLEKINLKKLEQLYYQNMMRKISKLLVQFQKL